MASVLKNCPICERNYREAQGCCEKPTRAPYQRRATTANDEITPDSGPQRAQTPPEAARLFAQIYDGPFPCWVMNEGGEYRVIRNIDSYSDYDLAKRLVLTCNWSTTIEDVKEAL